MTDKADPVYPASQIKPKRGPRIASMVEKITRPPPPSDYLDGMTGA